MNSYSFVAFFAVLAIANAGIVVGPSAKIIQGPSTRTTVVGPDGSAISAVAPGGQIIQEESAGVVAHAAPVVAYSAPVVSAHVAAPAVAYSAPVVSAHVAAPVVAYSAPVVAAPHVSAYSVPVVSAHSAPIYAGVSAIDTVVAGPSGTIATSKSVAAPVVSAW